MKLNRPTFALTCSLLVSLCCSALAQDTTGITASTAAATDTGDKAPAKPAMSKHEKWLAMTPEQQAKWRKDHPQAPKQHAKKTAKKREIHEQWQNMTLDQREQWQREHPGEIGKIAAKHHTRIGAGGGTVVKRN